MPEKLEELVSMRMLDRYRKGLVTKQEMDQFLELERRRAEMMERALQAGREPGRAIEDQE